jgi:hypothetical protein
MGKYIPERDWISETPTEQEIRRILAEYNENIHKYETKGFRTPGVRARKNLIDLYPLLKKRRKEILDGYKNKPKLVEHPSWEGIEDDAS